LLIVFIRVAFGNRYGPVCATATWCLVFAVMIAVIWVQTLLNRRWSDAGVLLLVAGAFGVVMWFVAHPAVTSVICMRVACFYPVAP
jgi:hypothetical protein